MQQPVYYLAYGSNLHPGRLHARLGQIEVVGTCALNGWVLVFNKRGEDGSAKANIVPSARREDRVWCALYRVPAVMMPELDRYETRGYGYDRVEFRLGPGIVGSRFGEAVSVYSYISPPPWQDDRLLPYDWYLGLVRAGAGYHGFPESYQKALSDQSCMPDPDDRRGRDRHRLLSMLEKPGVCIS